MDATVGSESSDGSSLKPKPLTNATATDAPQSSLLHCTNSADEIWKGVGLLNLTADRNKIQRRGRRVRMPILA